MTRKALSKVVLKKIRLETCLRVLNGLSHGPRNKSGRKVTHVPPFLFVVCNKTKSTHHPQRAVQQEQAVAEQEGEEPAVVLRPDGLVEPGAEVVEPRHVRLREFAVLAPRRFHDAHLFTTHRDRKQAHTQAHNDTHTRARNNLERKRRVSDAQGREKNGENS